MRVFSVRTLTPQRNLIDLLGLSQTVSMWLRASWIHHDRASKPGLTMSQIPDVLTGLERYLERGIGGGELVEYSIYGNELAADSVSTELAIGSYGRVVHAWNHSDEQKRFIRSVFERLDPLLDLDFVESAPSGDSDINIYRSSRNSFWESNALFDVPSDWVGGGSAHSNYDRFDLSWRDVDAFDAFAEAEKSSLVHEIGHALGLRDLADDPKWTRYDSIMSYNHPSDRPVNTWFSEADIHALQSVWGLEDDSF